MNPTRTQIAPLVHADIDVRMTKTNMRFRWCWRRLTLWRDFDYEPISMGAGGSDRVFTLWPKFLWWRITDKLRGQP